MFFPIFRAKKLRNKNDRIQLPLEGNANYFKIGALCDPFLNSTDLSRKLKSSQYESYYSVFQLDHLNDVLSLLTLEVHLDGFILEKGKRIDWKKNGEKWEEVIKYSLQVAKDGEHRRGIATLCQCISNRYFPVANGDQRKINIPVGPRHSFDPWISIYDANWDWNKYARSWNSNEIEQVFNLNPSKLLDLYEWLSFSQRAKDPLESWYQLVQFVPPAKRKKLKGEALYADSLRCAANMLRLLYKDLYGEDLPVPNEVGLQMRTHIPEKIVRSDVRRYMEFVVNQYDLNPQPRLTLFVEGQSEEIAISYIFEKYFGAHHGKFGIEIVNMHGNENMTGGKKGAYIAILKLIDYLHHHQIITFIIIDNEGFASNLKKNAKKYKSIHSKKRYVTRDDYIKVWKDCFEFDNFSCREIAKALTQLTGASIKFLAAEVKNCKSQKNSMSQLESLYKQRTGCTLNKPKLSEILAKNMINKDGRVNLSNKPLIKILDRIASLALRNPQPTMQEIWEENQSSSYLGKRV